MTHPATSTLLTLFAGLHVFVIVAPAAALAIVAHKGGLADAHGFDLLVASMIIGGAHAVIVRRRLTRELEHGVAFASVAIAALDALVVLAVLSTGLLFLILGGFAAEHAAIVNHGWKVVWLWVGVLLVAVGAAELVRTGVVRWLSEAQRAGRAPAPSPPRVEWASSSDSAGSTAPTARNRWRC